MRQLFVAIPPILRPARRCFCMEHSLNGGGKHDAAKIVDGMDQLKMNGNGGKLNARDDSNGITLSETTKPINKSKVVGIGRLEDGTFGPTGIYGGWVGRSRMLDLFRQTLKISRLERIEKVLKQRCSRVQCVFENLHDAANGAACMRTMESFGLQYCHAIESYDPFDVNTGVAMAADKWMTVTRYKNCFEASDRLKEQGFTLIATCLDEDSIPIDQVDFSSMKKIAVLFGNEERGLSLGFTKRADVKCHLPSLGFTKSYNLSVSCAIALYHLYQKGLIVPDLTKEEATQFYKQWVVRSTKKARFLIDKHKLHDDCDDF